MATTKEAVHLSQAFDEGLRAVWTGREDDPLYWVRHPFSRVVNIVHQ
jgi:hypothetical protein